MERRPLTLTDLTSLRTVSDPRISPDGRRVAFVVETIDPAANAVRSAIWLVEADASAPPRPLTSDTFLDSQPRWSPDGRVIAFVSNRSGTRQVWLLPMEGGEPRRLTDHPLGAGEPCWSPTGDRIAFLAAGPDRRGDPVAIEETDDRRRVLRIRTHRHKLDGQGFFGAQRTHLWLISLDGGPAVQLTDGPFDDAMPAWSPDGTRIAFISDRSADRDTHYGGGAVHLVDVATGTVRQLTSERHRAASPAWSPDGRQIAYVSADAPDDASAATARLWVLPADGGEPRCLTADLDRSVGHRPGGYLTPSPPVWQPDGTALLYLLGDGPSTHLVLFGPDGRRALTDGRRVVLSFSVDRSGRRAALLVTDPVTPPEVWLWTAEAEAIRPLTTLNAAWLARVVLAQPEDLRLRRPDGMVIEGWLLRPPVPSAGQLPLILTVHGGPHNYFGDTFSFDHQLLAAHGYAVLLVNPRGSGGYGEAFARAVLGDWGGEDLADLLAVLDHVVARGDPPIDPARLGITGLSYGGYMTCWAISQTDRFAAAVAGACIANLISFFGTSDIGASWGLREFGGPPHARLDWYLARSPLLQAERIRTPLLLYHGEADLRCPIEQSEQMFSVLRQLGRTVEFLRVPAENHGILNGSPAHRLAVRQAILDWFARYLAPAATPSGQSASPPG